MSLSAPLRFILSIVRFALRQSGSVWGTIPGRIAPFDGWTQQFSMLPSLPVHPPCRSFPLNG